MPCRPNTIFPILFRMCQSIWMQNCVNHNNWSMLNYLQISRFWEPEPFSSFGSHLLCCFLPPLSNSSTNHPQFGAFLLDQTSYLSHATNIFKVLFAFELFAVIHCTMEKLKNGVKSGELWQIISPPIFNENSPNLEGWCKNIQKIKKIIDFPNIFKKGFLKL